MMDVSAARLVSVALLALGLVAAETFTGKRRKGCCWCGTQIPSRHATDCPLSPRRSRQ